MNQPSDKPSVSFLPSAPSRAPTLYRPAAMPPVNRAEVLRYLGYGNRAPDPATEELLGRCSAELAGTAQPRALFAAFPLKGPDKPEAPLRLGGCELALPGEDIAAHLRGCSAAVLLCATLSAPTDALIRRAQLRDMAAGLVMDCCATAWVEQLCDLVEQQAKPLFPGAQFTTRFSPGYGDLPLLMQAAFLAALDAPRKIGLCATDASILTPRKSVTALFGVAAAAPSEPRTGCGHCRMNGRCAFQRKGETCGLSHASQKETVRPA